MRMPSFDDTRDPLVLRLESRSLSACRYRYHRLVVRAFAGCLTALAVGLGGCRAPATSDPRQAPELSFIGFPDEVIWSRFDWAVADLPPGMDFEDGNLVAQRKGRHRWRVPLPHARAKALVHDGLLYVASFDPRKPNLDVACLDPATGTTVWRTTGLEAVAFGRFRRHEVRIGGVQESVLVMGDLESWRYLRALDPGNGRVLSSLVATRYPPHPDDR